MFWKVAQLEQTKAPADFAPTGRFVLQRHTDAQGEHLDLRIEADGHLRGWRIDAATLNAGAWATVNEADVAVVSPVALKASVNDPPPVTPRFANVAIPFTAATVVVPTRVPVPLAIDAVISVVASSTRLCVTSSTRTTGGVVKAMPEAAPAGCWLIASAVAMASGRCVTP